MANPLAPPSWSDHGKFGTGMVQDVPRHLIPDTAVWDAQDVFLGEDGTLHKRGSTVTALSSGSTVSGSVVALAQGNFETALLKGYIIDESNGAAGQTILGAFTPATGTFAVTTSSWTNCLVSANGVGRPFQHNGYGVVPFRGPTAGSASAYRMFAAVAGSTSTAASNTTTITVTAGSRALTGFTAPDAASILPGHPILLMKTTTTADQYVGRVTSVSGTTVYVTPTPTRSFTSTTLGWFVETLRPFLEFIGSGVSSWRGAQGGASWQNRAVWGGVVRELAAAIYEHLPNRVIWSLLPTELSSVNALADGDLWVGNYGYPENNYADVPWMDKVLGLEPVSDGELLITGRPMCSRLVGTLNTNTTTSGGLTYELRPLNQRIMCIDDRATAKTPIGVMMMGPDGVYLYREGNLINTMTGRIQNYFLTNIASATVYGAGLLPNNHYYVSTSAGTLLCNLDGFRWTRFQNVSITNPIIDPANTTRVFAARYQPGTSSNTTKLLRVDHLVNPSSSATTDVSGTGPLGLVDTKAYPEGDASVIKSFKHVTATVRMPGSTGTVTVTSQPGLDGEETGTTLGTYSNATSAQTKRFETVGSTGLTTRSRAYGMRLAQTGNPNECEFIDVDISSKPNRIGRVS